MRERGRRTAHDLWAVAVALLAHGLGLVVIGHLAGAARAPAQPASELETALVDLVEESEGLRDAPGASARDAEAAAREAPASASVARATHQAPVNEPELGLAALAAPDVTASAAPAAAAPAALGSAVSELTARPIDLGIGPNAWTRWLGAEGTSGPATPSEPRTQRPVVRVAPASTTGGLQEGLEALDHGRAAGPSGRVVTALEQAAHGEGATAFGVARFLVTVLGTGAVEVRLERATAGEAEWKLVGARAAKALAANAPRIPPPRKGARFTVELVAEMAMPNGLRVKDLHGLRLEATPPRLQSTAEGQRGVIERNPVAAGGVAPTEDKRANVELPGVYLAETGKVCSYRLGLSLLGPLVQGGCDPVNAGAKPQRVVHGKVREQELF